MKVEKNELFMPLRVPALSRVFGWVLTEDLQ